MAAAAALRRFASASGNNCPALLRRNGASVARTAAAAPLLGVGGGVGVGVPALAAPTSGVVIGRRMRHDHAAGRRPSAFPGGSPPPSSFAPPSPSSSSSSSAGDLSTVLGRRAREELLEQLCAAAPSPSSSSLPPTASAATGIHPPRRYLSRRGMRAAAAAASTAASPPMRTKKRRRWRRPNDGSLAPPPPYSRPLSLRGRDEVNGGWSRLTPGGGGGDDDCDDGFGIVAWLKVRSVHAANSINVADVLLKVFGGGAIRTTKDGGGDGDGGGGGGGDGLSPKLRPLRHVFGKTSLVVQLPPVARSDRRGDGAPGAGTIAAAASADAELDLPRYVAVFRFGAVVFFNVSSADAGRILEDVKRCAGSDPVSSGFERRENFEVAFRPGMDGIARANGDYATVRDLDMNSVAVISTIMAQTVAIDSYSDEVDELLASFADINSAVRKTGSFTDMEKAGLFKAVAQNNSLLIDMIGKLGIKDRSDTAWNLSQYERVWDDMREEFEIDGRFGQIEFKLNLIQQNAKFFLEMLHHQKTNSLEWIIVVLIGFECVLMCLEMSGMGVVVFASLPLDKLPFGLVPPKG